MWIILSIPLLLAINYLLLYNKLFICIDCTVLIIAVIKWRFDRLDFFSLSYNSSYPSAFLLEVFLISLILATARLLMRHDLRFTASRRPNASCVCLMIVLFFWSVMLFSHPVLGFSKFTYRQAFKDLGFALEAYSTDHGMKYPETLSGLEPKYFLKPYSAPLARVKERDRRFYEKKYGLKLDISYETNADHSSYTLYVCGRKNTAGRPYSYMIYNSAIGLEEP